MAASKNLGMVMLMLVISGCNGIPPEPPPPSTVYSGMDAFHQELAKRVANRFGASNAKDFQVIVSQASFPIGTLLRPSSTIPIDYTACLPSSQPNKVEANSLFPSYSLTKGLAIDIGFDNEVIKKLLDFGIEIKDKDQISYSVKSPKLQVLADTNIKALTAKGNCAQVIGKETVWLIRGYVEGQRNFSFKNELTNKLKGNLDKVASFNIGVDSGSATISVSDENPTSFLQVVSEIQPTASGAKVTTLSASHVSGKIYVQRDRHDMSDSGVKIVEALMRQKFLVERTVEGIDSSRVPKIAQVRYFNDTDVDIAGRVLVVLRKQYPDAVMLRVGLPAPKGQLEVWLPRVK